MNAANKLIEARSFRDPDDCNICHYHPEPAPLDLGLWRNPEEKRLNKVFFHDSHLHSNDFKLDCKHVLIPANLQYI